MTHSLRLRQVYKLFIVVELLMGEIPERSVFRQPVLKKALVPYLQIVQGEQVAFLWPSLKFPTNLFIDCHSRPRRRH